MKALDRLPPAQGIAAMQSINITVINPPFMTAFSGTAAGCVILTIFSLVTWQRPGAVFLLVGSVLYLFGTILVTIVFNMPKNKALASVTPADPDGASLWSSYSSLARACTWQVRKDAGRS